MRILLVSILGLLAACSGKTAESIVVDTTFNSTLAAQTLSTISDRIQRMKVHYVCGPSAGKSASADVDLDQLANDGITDGRLVFVSGADGSGANLLFRDATGSFQSALQLGAEVKFYNIQDGRSGQVWTVAYPQTGVVEVHNLSAADGKIVDLYTSSKPSVILPSASARIFKANCVRP